MNNARESACPEMKVYREIIMGAKTLIFDRDGTINVDKGYVYKITEFEFTKQFLRIVPALQIFNGNICIITNQGGVRLGKFLKTESQKFTRYLVSKAEENGVHINSVITCYHHDLDNCNFRKPSSGMLQELEKKIEASAKSYLYIGNDNKDVQVAKDRNIDYLDIDSNEIEMAIIEWMNN